MPPLCLLHGNGTVFHFISIDSRTLSNIKKVNFPISWNKKLDSGKFRFTPFLYTNKLANTLVHLISIEAVKYQGDSHRQPPHPQIKQWSTSTSAFWSLRCNKIYRSIFLLLYLWSPKHQHSGASLVKHLYTNAFRHQAACTSGQGSRFFSLRLVLLQHFHIGRVAFECTFLDGTQSTSVIPDHHHSGNAEWNGV